MALPSEVVSEFRFVCSADYIRTIHETTPNRTNKAASCGFVDRSPSQANLSNQETETLPYLSSVTVPSQIGNNIGFSAQL